MLRKILRPVPVSQRIAGRAPLDDLESSGLMGYEKPHMLESQTCENRIPAIDAVVKREPEDEGRQPLADRTINPESVTANTNVSMKRRASIDASSLSTVKAKKEHYVDADTNAALARLGTLGGSRWATPGQAKPATPKAKPKPQGLQVKLAPPTLTTANTSQAIISIKQEVSPTPPLNSLKEPKKTKANAPKTTTIEIDHHLTPSQLDTYLFPEGKFKGKPFNKGCSVHRPKQIVRRAT